jgi:CubicO group peptidase (beta-lactamase class C family)
LKTTIQTPICLLLSLALLLSCQPKNKNGQITHLLNDYHEKGEFNGAILIAEKGNIIYDTAIGFANLDTKEPLTTESVFYLASLSKQFTAMGIMQLAKQHQLSYDDTITRYFPQLPAYAKSITIRHLLNHSSGIKDYFETDSLIKPGLTNKQVLQWLTTQQASNFPAGEKYSYSNTGYVLLAMIIEKVTAQPLPAWMQDHIFRPLHMTHTLVFDSSTPPVPNRAIGLNKEGKPDDYNILTTGDGGLFSTTHDLLLWDQALYHDTLFSRVVQQAYTRPQLSYGHFSNYGFGWSLVRKEHERAAFHTGSLNGYRALIWRNLTKQQTLIILTNKNDTLRMKPLGNQILDILDSSKLRMR